MPGYHDLYITTEKIPRTSIFNLPFNLMVTCTRMGGWELWNREALIAGEFQLIEDGGCGGLRLDIDGHVIVDSLTPKEN